MSFSFDQIKKEFPSACTCGAVTCFYCFEDSFNAKTYIGESCNTVNVSKDIEHFRNIVDINQEDFEITTNVKVEDLGNSTDFKSIVNTEKSTDDKGVNYGNTKSIKIEDHKHINENTKKANGQQFQDKRGVNNTEEKYGMIAIENKKSDILGASERKIQFYNENPQELKPTKWIPPRSPYNLIQETLFHKPWQLLVATIFLNKTSARVAVPLFWKFVNKWSTPENLQNATIIEIAALMQPLGLNVRRAIQIKRFTYDFLHKDWCYPRELTGIGQYGDDSYRIFCVNEWKDVKPQDSKLKKYIAWLMENQERLCIT